MDSEAAMSAYSYRNCHPCGIEIIRESDSESIAFLQGDDQESLEKQIESLEKMLRHKKIGQKRHDKMLDEILEAYDEDA